MIFPLKNCFERKTFIETKKNLSKQDIVMSMVKGSEVPASNTKHGNLPKLIQDHKNRQHQIRQQIQNKAEALASEVVQEYLERKPYRSTQGFTKFPSPDLVRQMTG